MSSARTTPHPFHALQQPADAHRRGWESLAGGQRAAPVAQAAPEPAPQRRPRLPRGRKPQTRRPPTPGAVRVDLQRARRWVHACIDAGRGLPTATALATAAGIELVEASAVLDPFVRARVRRKAQP